MQRRIFDLARRQHRSIYYVRSIKVIKVISPLTMGVYILHPIVLKITSSLFARNSVLSCILLYVVTFGGALAGAFFIKVIRLDTYLMKI